MVCCSSCAVPQCTKLHYFSFNKLPAAEMSTLRAKEMYKFIKSYLLSLDDVGSATIRQIRTAYLKDIGQNELSSSDRESFKEMVTLAFEEVVEKSTEDESNGDKNSVKDEVESTDDERLHIVEDDFEDTKKKLQPKSSKAAKPIVRKAKSKPNKKCSSDEEDELKPKSPIKKAKTKIKKEHFSDSEEDVEETNDSIDDDDDDDDFDVKGKKTGNRNQSVSKKGTVSKAGTKKRGRKKAVESDSDSEFESGPSKRKTTKKRQTSLQEKSQTAKKRKVESDKGSDENPPTSKKLKILSDNESWDDDGDEGGGKSDKRIAKKGGNGQRLPVGRSKKQQRATDSDDDPDDRSKKRGKAKCSTTVRPKKQKVLSESDSGEETSVQESDGTTLKPKNGAQILEANDNDDLSADNSVTTKEVHVQNKLKLVIENGEGSTFDEKEVKQEVVIGAPESDEASGTDEDEGVNSVASKGSVVQRDNRLKVEALPDGEDNEEETEVGANGLTPSSLPLDKTNDKLLAHGNGDSDGQSGLSCDEGELVKKRPGKAKNQAVKKGGKKGKETGNADKGDESSSGDFSEESDEKKQSGSDGNAVKKSDLKIERLKRYIRTAGIRVQYVKLFNNCGSTKKKVEKLLSVLADAGLKGKPTLESCKKLNRKRAEQQELAGLDTSNILCESGRTRRRCSDNQLFPIERRGKSAPASLAPRIFSRLKDIVDSGDSD